MENQDVEENTIMGNELMQNIIKEILISQMSFPLEYKNEKEIWWKNEWDDPITVEIIDIENERYMIREYSDNGQLRYKDNYRQGQKHGKCLEWWDNGQLYSRINYRQGQLHGECLEWWDNGQLEYKVNYHQGQRHGKVLKWHKNGQLWYKADCHQGRLSGEYLEWNIDGKLINEEYY